MIMYIGTTSFIVRLWSKSITQSDNDLCIEHKSLTYMGFY